MICIQLTVPFARNKMQKLSLLLRSEIPSGKCAEIRTVAASNNRDHSTKSLYFCLFAPRIYGYCSSRTFRSWWTAQRQRRGCNTTKVQVLPLLRLRHNLVIFVSPHLALRAIWVWGPAITQWFVNIYDNLTHKGSIQQEFVLKLSAAVVDSEGTVWCNCPHRKTTVLCPHIVRLRNQQVYWQELLRLFATRCCYLFIFCC